MYMYVMAGSVSRVEPHLLIPACCTPACCCRAPCSPDGTLLACREVGGATVLWDVSGPKRLKQHRRLEGCFRDALFRPSAGDLLLYEWAGAPGLTLCMHPSGHAWTAGRAARMQTGMQASAARVPCMLGDAEMSQVMARGR